MDSEITALAYSEHMALLASGSQNGIIALWDFDTGKLETSLLGHEGEITSLVFIESHSANASTDQKDAYPLLLSSSSDGTIYMWGLRGINTAKWRNRAIAILHHTYKDP